ncbi:MAG TPA: type VI secretion system tip protein TssI/VgrG [Burkholderiaceae bacterium]|nr:type VI secretion system tip protein TssI/VgrG [Burkholderiaceae bacterium]
MASLSNRLAANKRFEFESKAFDADKFAVVNMEGYEAISRPYRFTLTLVSDDAAIDMDTMLQNPAALRIFAPDGTSATPYHGVLAEFEQLHQADGYVFYRAVLVPRLWRLSLYRISEVYLNEQTIPAIIEGVLKDSRFGPADFQLKLTTDYRPRSFVCQYQETHLDFLSRWMEKEGMYYFFEQDDQAEKLIIADSRVMHPAQPSHVNYRPIDELDTGVAPDSVQNFVCRQKPLPHQVVLQDYNHRKASLELKAQAIVSATGIGDVMLYGENFRSIEDGERYARLRAEEILCNGKVFSGAGTAVGLRSGQFMELAHHYRPDFNGKYLVTEIHHEGSQAGALLAGIKNPYSGNDTETIYRNTFQAIPATVQFRAERVTAKPRVAGTMNATIDAEGSGEYAELDEYGQYKVQLPFDRSDKAHNKGSARVRMATPYSGSDHGMHFPLHKNAEVLLSFIDGDPDQPVIVGAVPNSENRSIVNFNNPQDNRISTKGGNQLHMSDSKGKEVIWLHSPFHHSSIGVGSINPNGGGSIFSATKGSSESVSFGTSGSMSFGSKNSLSIGTETSIAASFANKISMGASVAISCANDIKWNMNMIPFTENVTKSLTIDDSSSVKLDTSTKQVALDEVIISAGAVATNVLANEVKATKATLKKMIAAFTALNMTQSAIFGAAVNGHDELLGPDEKKAKQENAERKAQEKDARDKEKKKKQAEIDADATLSDAEKIKRKTALDKEYAKKDGEANSPMNDDSFTGWPGIVGKFGTDVVSNVGALAVLQGYARTLATKIEVLKSSLVSRITLNDKGIKLSANVPNNANSKLSLDDKGLKFITGPYAPPTPPNVPEAPPLPAMASSIAAKDGSMTVSAGTKLALSSLSEIEAKVNPSTLSITKQQIELKYGSGKMTVTPNQVSATFNKMGFEVTKTKAMMTFGGAAVKATKTGLKLSLGNSNADLDPQGLSLQGGLIRLG